jgi:hypothetical protein
LTPPKKARTFVLFCALLAASCITHVSQQCPSCPYTDGLSDGPSLRPGVRRLFVLVPGALGYGWEWDAAIDALKKAHGDFLVFWWNPWLSLSYGAERLREVLQTAQWVTPSLTEIVVVAHSAGGMVAAQALDGLRVSPGRHIELVTIGTPFAGMGTSPVTGYDDPLRTPAVIAIGGHFHRYPDPPAGVSVLEYVTSWPPDEVMKPRYGWRPAPPEVGPRGARRVPVDPKLDHNYVVARVVGELLARPQRDKVEPGR